MKQVRFNDAEENYNAEAFLMHAADEVQADTVESLLRSYEIPVLKKRREAGGYLNITTGMNIFGVDLYVPAKLHKAANALIKGPKKYNEDLDEEFSREEEAFRRKRLMKIWIIIGIFYSPVLIWLVINIIRG